MRGGTPPGPGSITGTVRDAGSAGQPGAPVQACPEAGGPCVVGVAGGGGKYTLGAVNPGSWRVTALPSAVSALLAGRAGPLTVAGTPVTQDLTLGPATAPPSGTTLAGAEPEVTTLAVNSGLPVVHWNETLTLTSACPAASAVTYTLS